jgi:hypothetical protein
MATNKNVALLMHTQKGSSLIGVAILTLVMGFLMTGGIFLMKNYDVIKADQKTVDTSIALQEALDNFIAIEKRYPCPAPIDVAPDVTGFGLEDCSISDTAGRDGNVKIGAAPVRTLNIPDKMIVDGYGKRHIYAVTSSMTVPSADILHGLGSIYIYDEAGISVSKNEGYVTYALLSPGKDDRGTYDIQGREIAPCPTGTTAGENCDGNATFVSSSKKIFRGEATDFTHSFTFKASSFEYDWVANDWNDCDGICFSGSQTRTVTCQDKQGNTVPSAEESDIDKCGHTSRPILSRACSLGACSWSNPLWSSCPPNPYTGGEGEGPDGNSDGNPDGFS